MNIALIAHDEKKELMVQFCIAYCGVLSRNNLCATGTTGKIVSEATGLTIQKFLAGSQGGSQQIAARIACNEIDMLLFFRDPLSPKPNEPNDMNMLRLWHNAARLLCFYGYFHIVIKSVICGGNYGINHQENKRNRGRSSQRKLSLAVCRADNERRSKKLRI